MNKTVTSYRYLLTSFIALIGLAAILAIAWDAFRTDSEGTVGRLQLGREAPELTGIDTNGRAIDLREYRGQPVIINFWASWCKPCVSEMPLIDEVYRKSPVTFQLISVNVGDTKGTVLEFLRENDISFPVLIDATGKAAERYRVTGLPATFAIDSNGRVSHAGAGQITDDDQLLALVRGESLATGKSEILSRPE